jgi:putative membrane protein
MSMAWLLFLHVATLAIWSAALFYLPVVFNMNRGLQRAAAVRLRVMTRLAFIALASPAAVLAIVTGSALVYVTDATGSWLAAKLLLVSLMAAFHVYCGRTLTILGHEGTDKKRRRRTGLWMLGIPMLLISGVLWLVLAKPELVRSVGGAPW